MLGASRQATAGRGEAGRGQAGRGGAARGDGYGGRCCAPTALRCSPRGRAAKLAALATRAPLGQSPRVRGTKRAARADPEAALLGAADIAPRTCPPRRPPRAAPGLRPGPLSPAAQATSVVFGAKTGTLAANTATLPATARAARRRRACAQPRSAAVPAGARSALRLLTRRDCPSAARAASVASFAARPALRASQGTPAQRGPAPARRRRAARAVARAIVTYVSCPASQVAPPPTEQPA